MSEHWDCSDQAGSKSRGRAAFGEPLPSLETLAVVDGEVKTLNNQLVVHQSVFLLFMDGPKRFKNSPGIKNALHQRPTQDSGYGAAKADRTTGVLEAVLG